MQQFLISFLAQEVWRWVSLRIMRISFIRLRLLHMIGFIHRMESCGIPEQKKIQSRQNMTLVLPDGVFRHTLNWKVLCRIILFGPQKEVRPVVGSVDLILIQK